MLRLCLAATMTLALCAGGATLAGGAAAAKKKGKKPNSFSQTLAPNLAIPDGPAGGPATPASSTITVPKKFKGKVVGDLDVTGITTTGAAAGAAGDLIFLLTAPNGRTVQLFENIGDTSIGPLTLNDDSRAAICDSATATCEDPNATLLRPFAGTSSMIDADGGIGSRGTGPLSSFSGVRMHGAWTLSVYDDDPTPPTQTSTLNSWGLSMSGAKPVKAGKKGSSSFSQTATVNGAVPDEVALGPSTPLVSTITVPKKFKGRVVGDVNLTGFTTTGSGAGAAADIRLRLSAPNGRSIIALDATIGDVSIGPLTLDDDTKTMICDDVTPTCEDPYATLLQPFAGTANTQLLGIGGASGLSHLDGVAMNGVWTLQVWDEASVGLTSTFNSWGLAIKVAKPVSG